MTQTQLLTALVLLQEAPELVEVYMGPPGYTAVDGLIQMGPVSVEAATRWVPSADEATEVQLVPGALESFQLPE